MGAARSGIGILRPGLAAMLSVIAMASVQHYRDDVHPANEASRIYAAMALVDHGTPVLDPIFDRFFPGWRTAPRPPNVDVAIREGHYHLDKAPGLSLLAVPGLWFLRLLDGDLPFRWLTWGLALSLCAIPGALWAWLADRRLTRAGLPTWPAWAALLASPWLAYGGMLFGHALSAALVGLALLLGIGSLQGSSLPARREALLGGMAAGLAVLVEYPTVFWVALGGLVLCADPGRRYRLPWFLLGGLPFAVVLLAWNTWNFGSPFALSYAFKSNADLQAIHGQGAYGFTWPSVERLWGILASGRRGLLFVAPWLGAGLVGGVLALRERETPLAWRLAILLGAWGWPVFIAGFVDWTAGMTFGPRHLLPGIPVLTIGVALAVRRMETWSLRDAMPALVASSFLANGVAAWTFPYIHPDVPNPLGQVLVPVLVQAGPAPTIWDAWLPRPGGLLAALVAGFWVLAWAFLRSPFHPRGGKTGSWTRRAAVSVLAFVLHSWALLGLAGTSAAETRAVLQNRALAFEMMGRDDLAATVRRGLGAPAGQSPILPDAPSSP